MPNDELPAHIQAWHEESWTFHGGNYHEEDTHMYVDYCVFEDGEHYPGRYCPHDDIEDELTPGWTVLNQRAPLTKE